MEDVGKLMFFENVQSFCLHKTQCSSDLTTYFIITLDFHLINEVR